MMMMMIMLYNDDDDGDDYEDNVDYDEDDDDRGDERINNVLLDVFRVAEILPVFPLICSVHILMCLIFACCVLLTESTL